MIPVTPSGSTTVTINSLTPGTLYEFQVIGKNALGDGMLSKLITIRTLGKRPFNFRVKRANCNFVSSGILRFAAIVATNDPTVNRLTNRILCKTFPSLFNRFTHEDVALTHSATPSSSAGQAAATDESGKIVIPLSFRIVARIR